MTRNTTVTCSAVPSDGSECMFAVQAFTCNHSLGNWSDIINVNLTGASVSSTFTRGL